jgi:hypothetical protein
MSKITHIFYVIIIYCFTSRSKIFHLYGNVTIAGERLQNLGLCSALRAFVQRGIFIVQHLLGPRFFRCHPKDRPIQLPVSTHKGMWSIYSNLDPHGLYILYRTDDTVPTFSLKKVLTSSWPIRRVVFFFLRRRIRSMQIFFNLPWQVTRSPRQDIKLSGQVTKSPR